jgi:uncharacterized membrane protein
MRLRLIGCNVILTTALGLFVGAGLTGCTKESPKGGPGAPSAPNTTGANTDSFTLKAPSATTSITQGQDHEVTVSVSRGSKFDQDVKVTFKAPAGIEIKPDTATAKKGSDDIKVSVHAKADAKVGKEDVEVIGTPTNGAATTVRFPVEVKAKS